MANQNRLYIDDRDFVKKTNKIVNDFPDFLKYILTKTGGMLLKKVKYNTPVDTGYLRRMWHLNKPHIKEEESYIEVKNNTEYALPVENGSVHGSGFRPGKHMLKRSMKELESGINEILEKEFQNYINKHGGGK